MRVEVGDKVYVPNEKKPYKVRTRDDRYIICTKPYNPRHTVLYTIFEAHVEKVDITEMGDKTRKVLTAINCEYAERCERMYKRIQEGRANETTVVQCGV